jgi:hypothetical protein
MDSKRVKELIGYLVSMASFNDAEMAKQFAEELDKLLPGISYHDVNDFYPDNE